MYEYFFADRTLYNDDGCYSISNKEIDLLPAWNGALVSDVDNEFIWYLIDSKEDGYIPIMVCPDDCDLSCVVVCVSIRRENGRVYWDRVGMVVSGEYDREKELRSGIMFGKSDTEDPKDYYDWMIDNWKEEQLLRYKNYLKPYINEHMIWTDALWFEFDENEYDSMVEAFRP